MPNSLAKISKVLKPLGGKIDAVVAIKLHHQEISIAEIRASGKSFHVITLGNIRLPRPVDPAAIHLNQEMITDAIRSLKDQIGLTVVDAAIIIPGQIIQIREINLPYLSPKEITRETKDMAFWIEYEPDLEKFDDPVLSFQILQSSEDDDLTRILLTFAESAHIQPWIDIVLAAHLNPVFLESDALSLINLRYITLPIEDQRQGQMIIQLDRNFCQCLAFERHHVHRIKLEISEFDLVLLDQARETNPLEGDFWEEVSGRVANVIRQAILYLKEEQDFEPPSKVYLVSEYDKCENILPLLSKQFDLAPLILWNPFQGISLSLQASACADRCSNPTKFASTIGTSLQKLGIYGEKGHTPFSVNILPRHKILQRNRQISVITTTFSRGLMISIFLLAGWTAGFIVPQYIDSERISRDYKSLEFNSDHINAQINEAMEALQKIGHEIEIMRILQSSSFRTSFLETLPDLLPDRMELASLEMKQSNEVKITGFARMEQAITLFQQELHQSGFIDQSSIETVKDKDFISFTLIGKLRKTE
ncbi:PilN domain-containing protein [Alphaproteobacteria bacterium LSUCC0684]